MKIERICILGGSGFVGTHLVSQLAARGLTLPQSEFTYAIGRIALWAPAASPLDVERDARDLHAALRTVARPLNALDETALCPGADTLARINASLR